MGGGVNFRIGQSLPTQAAWFRWRPGLPDGLRRGILLEEKFGSPARRFCQRPFLLFCQLFDPCIKIVRQLDLCPDHTYCYISIKMM
jgi:hypothetical protein